MNGQYRNSTGNFGGFILSNGNLVYIMSSSQNCTETANAGANMPICGYIYEDVNGFNGPNTCGKDIYLVWVTENGLIPAGYYKDNKGIVSCQQGANGLGCSLLYLEQ